MSKVFDFSKWNTITDYSKVAKECDGVILRLGYRGASSGTISIDPVFIKNAEEFAKVNTPISIYFFSTAISEKEAEEEAKFCIEILTRYNISIKYPIFIDTEYCNGNHNGRSDKLSKDQRTKIVNAFINLCNKYGYSAAIYASESWFTSMLDYSKIKDTKKWVAKYSSNKPSVTDNVIGWQYTSTGTSSGVKGNIDISEWYEDVNTNISKPSTTSSKDNKKFTDGQKISLQNADLFTSSTTSTVVRVLSGVFYIWNSSIHFKEY